MAFIKNTFKSLDITHQFFGVLHGDPRLHVDTQHQMPFFREIFIFASFFTSFFQKKVDFFPYLWYIMFRAWQTGSQRGIVQG